MTLDLEFGGVAKDPWGNTKVGFTATADINRKDFGLEWNAALETGGVLVGDKINLELDVEAVLQTAAADYAEDHRHERATSEPCRAVGA